MTLYPEKANEIKNYHCTENVFLPKTVTIPLSEEYNTVCSPLVKEGDLVMEGQVIASGRNKNRADIHSSLPGKVESIVSLQCPNGKTEKAIKISLGGTFSYLGKIIRPKKLSELQPLDIGTQIFRSGVVNTFNSRRSVNLGSQLSAFKGENIVIRLFDEDPSCITDRLITKFYFDQIIKASIVLAKGLNVKSVVFVKSSLQKIEEKKPENQAFKCSYYSLDDSRYTSGFKTRIISFVNKTKSKTEPVKLSKNDLFCDASTMYEVYQSVVLETPEINRLIHISGNCLKASGLLNVKIGMSLKDIISQIGGLTKTPKQIIINGNVRGYSGGSLDLPITKILTGFSLISG